jgi:acyl-homoserine-lactone acylase
VCLGLVAAACSDSNSNSAATTTTDSTSITTVTSPTETATTVADTTTVAPTTTVPAPRYSADITRTTYGIAHIVAGDWGSLGFGQGYAFAQDRACTLIDQVIKVRGERSKWFGPGDKDKNLDSDFAYRQLGLHDDADQRFAGQPANVVDMVRGYVDGFDAELDAEGVHGWCAGEPWVQKITTTDLYAYLNDVALFASSGVLLDQIATAQPPAGQPSPTTVTPSSTKPTTSNDTSNDTVSDTSSDTTAGAAETTAAMPDLRTDMASNGWAIGSSLSESGGGMLLANPHFPWEGEKRLWESQLTLTTGELNVYGATLSGIPGVLIGFNDAVAWTHTVSAGYRMTLYQLNLVPGDPTSYQYGDTTKKMTSKDVTIDVKQGDGSTGQVTRTMWSSHYGPMLNLPFGWTADAAYTMRDANLGNSDILKQFLGMDAAKSLDEFIDVHRTANGIPWVNTVATSADGRAWYADAAATPDLSAEAIAGWKQQVDSGGLAKTTLDNGAILLNGSDPANEWVDDPTATRPGILPFDQQPQVLRKDFVFNSNDSHWLVNPKKLLTGYSPLTGPEAVPQSARTRMNAVLLTDPAVRGDDGKFSLADVQGAIFSNRTLHAERLLEHVVKTCRRTHLVLVDEVPYDVTPACDVLAGWDGRDNVDSVGAALWREYMTLFSRADRNDAGALYKVGFDAKDPVGTPNTLNDASDQKVLANLGAAAKAMISAGFAIDAPLGDMQYDARAQADGAPRLALPGGTNVDGAASIVACCSGSMTLAPKGDPGTFTESHFFSDKGYPVSFGDSFVMTLEFTADGPHAEAVLTYGQPDDPSSPDYTAQTKLFAAGEFRPIYFLPQEIKANAVSDTVTVTGELSH